MQFAHGFAVLGPCCYTCCEFDYGNDHDVIETFSMCNLNMLDTVPISNLKQVRKIIRTCSSLDVYISTVAARTASTSRRCSPSAHWNRRCDFAQRRMRTTQDSGSTLQHLSLNAFNSFRFCFCHADVSGQGLRCGGVVSLS